MNAMSIIVVFVFLQLARQVCGIPKEYAIKILAPDCSDEPFDKRMGDRSVRNRLDLLDLNHAQVGEPTAKAEERIVIGTKGPSENNYYTSAS